MALKARAKPAKMSEKLDTYRAKRDFSKTSEPSGAEVTRPGWSYVIQKHAARRLHYDFRLELDGVLLSWAVPRGPSLNPSDRRLAARTEDHPIEYGDFEGIIPKGEYGGGTVIVWDRGSWTPEGDAQTGQLLPQGADGAKHTRFDRADRQPESVSDLCIWPLLYEGEHGNHL